MNSFYFTLRQLRTCLGQKDAVTYRRGQCALNPVLDGDDLMGNAQLQQEDVEWTVHAVMREYGVVCLRQRRPDKAERILAKAISSPFTDEGTIRLFIRAQYLAGDKRGPCLPTSFCAISSRRNWE